MKISNNFVCIDNYKKTQHNKFKSKLFSILFLMSIFYLSNLNNLSAQNSLGCATEVESANNSSSSIQNPLQNCSKTSSDWLTNYELIDSYKPTLNSNEAIKTIPINVVVFGNDDGSGFPFYIAPQGLDGVINQTPEIVNFPNYYDQNGNPIATYYNSQGIEISNPVSQGTINSNYYQGWVNQPFQHPEAPTLPNANLQICNPSTLPDTKIRIVIKHFYFYMNSSINNAQTNSGYSLFQSNIDLQARDYHFSLNPQAKENINCYQMKYFHIAGAQGWSYEKIPYLGYTDPENFPHITSSNQTYSPTYIQDWQTGGSAYWFFHNHLAHEIGHKLGLWHVYGSSETSAYNSSEFLDDVFNCPNPQPIVGGGNLMGGQFSSQVSPRQMGRMNRILCTDKTYSNILGTLTRHFAYGYSSIPHEITSNETWDFTYKSYNNIVVKRGATLTLKCRLEMVKEASIIVENGATLIIDGATITSARSGGAEHEGPWQGIKVWGTYNKNQFQLDQDGLLYQGRVDVLNGSIIENAEIAIEVSKPNTYDGGGGIVRMISSTIRNCWKGVHFTRYNNSVRSYFKDCIFETTANLINGDVPQVFIEAWDFKTLRITSCIFRNTNPNVTNINQLGNGIGLLSAKATISGFLPYSFNGSTFDFCNETNPDWKPNIFENLFKGVELINFGMQQTIGLYTSSVTRNFFKNCIYGIECKGMPAVSINQNKIVLGSNPVFHEYNEGIIHKSYTGFSISENCISQLGSNASYTGGIIISEVGGDNNDVYRNKSFDNENAYVSNGKNRTATIAADLKYKGLQFLCNQNNGLQLYDISVEGDGVEPPSPMNGIRYYQGGTGNDFNPKATGNLFTNGCSTSENNLFNSTPNAFEYFHSQTAFETPICYSWNVSPNNINVINNLCPSKFGNGIKGPDGILSASQKSMLLSNFAVTNSQYLATAIMYNSIIDNGNTQSLLQSISATLPNNALELKNLMISNSPNLSDAVVRNLVADNTILQNSDLVSIIAANPDVAHNEELLLMLKIKTNPMDNWMIDFLREAGTYQTNRTLIEQTFAQKQYERDEIAWQMVRHLLSDTISDTLNHTELHQWLNIIGSPRAKYMIADDFASLGNFLAATQVLNNMQVENLDRYEVFELNGLKQWLQLQKNLFSSGRNIYELTSNELSSIKLLAEEERKNGLAGTFAANVLNIYNPNKYVLKNIYPNSGSNLRTSNTNAQKREKRILKKLIEKETLNSNSTISIYPNPANNLTTIDLNSVLNVVKVNIYSIKGDMIISKSVLGEKIIEVNTSNLSNGTYNLQLLDAKGRNVKTETLIITHN